MRVFVTGGTGFIGSHLVEALLDKGREVRALVRDKGCLRWLKGLPVEPVEGSLEDEDSLVRALEGVEEVYHLAGLTKARNLREYLKTNAEGTRRIVEACVKADAGIRRFVLLSSLAASGPSLHGPKTESDPCSPVSHYGLSKLQAENYARIFVRRLPITIVRPPAVYGPRDRDIFAFFRLMRWRINPVIGAGDRLLSLCHVRDLVQGVILAARADLPSGEVFNISDGEIRSWSEVTGCLQRVMGVRAIRLRVPLRLARLAAVVSEALSGLIEAPPLLNRQKVLEMAQPAWTCSIHKAREVLGFRPSVGLEEGLKETYTWYREMGWL